MITKKTEWNVIEDMTNIIIVSEIKKDGGGFVVDDELYLFENIHLSTSVFPCVRRSSDKSVAVLYSPSRKWSTEKGPQWLFHPPLVEVLLKNVSPSTPCSDEHIPEDANDIILEWIEAPSAFQVGPGETGGEQLVVFQTTGKLQEFEFFDNDSWFFIV